MPSILLVEDDQSVRDFLQKVLTRAGYDVEAAPDGEVALRAYDRQPSDLVVTDIVMPEKEGIETLRALRKRNPGVKIIAISGGGIGPAAGYLDLARQLGATRVLAKPFSAEEILQVVAAVLSEPA